jgi:hypothetical protein
MLTLDLIASRPAVRHDEHSSGISLTEPAGAATMGAAGVDALHDNHTTSRLPYAPGAVWAASNPPLKWAAVLARRNDSVTQRDQRW